MAEIAKVGEAKRAIAPRLYHATALDSCGSWRIRADTGDEDHNAPEQRAT